MAQLLHHQESAFYGKEFHGRRWSILQFFGLRRRLRSTKLLSDKKHGQAKGSDGSRRRVSYVPLKDEDSGVMDDEKNTEITKKHKASKKNSGKASLRSLILRKLYGKEGQKEKMLPVAPKLLRNLSIHYLESNGHVLDGESSSNGDSSSHSTTLSMQNATSTNLHHATINTPDGCDTDTSSLLLLKKGDNHVKRKSHRSISMDGVLHKVPYGQKVSGDVIGEELSRSASATYDRDGLKPYIGAAKRHVNQGFRRSRSLTESLESYSHLLYSISSTESKRILTSSKSTRDHSLDGPSVITALQQSSNAEVRSKGLVRHAENLVIPKDALASHVPEKTIADGDVKVAMDGGSSSEVAGGCEIPALLEEYMNDQRCDLAVSSAPSSSEVIDISEEYTATCDDDLVPSSTAIVDWCTFPSISEEADFPEEHATTCDDDRIHSSTEADSCTALPPSEDANIAEHAASFDDNQIQSSYVLKSTEDFSLEQRILILNDVDDSAEIDVLDANTTIELSTTSLTHRNVQEGDSDDLYGFQVDQKNEAEFNYVKDIFKKSNFSNEMLFDEWYSQNCAALQEEDCQHYEAAAAAFDFTDMSADQLLLFDLTNEVLLDIYKKYSVCKSKLSWFSSFDRPKPVGNHVLKELWSKVSCHLDEQPRSSIEIDTILSNDLSKGNRWMTFQRDADHLGNKLADFVFDKLLTELTLQLAKF